MKLPLRSTLPLALVLLLSPAARAFDMSGCGKNCSECHVLTREEASKLLEGRVDKVLEVQPSEVRGLWTVAVERQGRKGPVYVDFSKKFLVAGNVIELATMESVTEAYTMNLNRVDVAQIPLGDAVVIGKADAPTKVIIFDDPECPFCIKLHAEVKKVVQLRPDIAFFVKMFPLAMHPNAKAKAKAIVCAKSAKLLDDSFAGKELPPAKCETDQVEKNIQLAEKLGIGSTPTLVLPDGRVAPGFKTAEKMIDLLSDKGTKPTP